jgi:S1-C subfamily serine protease
MKNFKFLRIIFWLVLLIGSFLGGVAWNGGALKNTGTEEQQLLADRAGQPEAIEAKQTFRNDLNPEEKATISLFEKAAPSVAFITTSNYRRDYWTRNITEIPRGTGSAFIWDKKGHIITNFHVIQGADRAQVTLADQSSWEAKVVGAAPEKTWQS